MTLALGQGGNMGLEDAGEFAALLSPIVANRSTADGAAVARALERFSQVRSERVQHIHFASREHAHQKNHRTWARL